MNKYLVIVVMNNQDHKLAYLDDSRRCVLLKDYTVELSKDSKCFWIAEEALTFAGQIQKNDSRSHLAYNN